MRKKTDKAAADTIVVDNDNHNRLDIDLSKVMARAIERLEIEDDTVNVELSFHVGTSVATYSENLRCGPEDKHPALVNLREKVAALYTAVTRAVRERALESGEIPCATCTGACCRNWNVFVTHDDAVRLQDAGLLAYVEQLEFDPGKHFGRMRQVQKVNPGTGAKEPSCIALGKDGLCTIYEARPTVCREFAAWDCDHKEEWVDVPKKRRLKVLQ